MNIPILTAVVGIIFGILISAYCSLSIPLIGCNILGLFCVALGLHLRALYRIPLEFAFHLNMFFLWFLIGVLCSTINDPKRKDTHFLHSKSTDHQRVSLVVDEVLKPTVYQNKYVASIYVQDSIRASGKLLLNIYKDTTLNTFTIGQHLRVYGTIQDLPSPRHPYQFDYGAYLKKRHIYGQLNVQSWQVLPLKQTSSSFKSVAGHFRESVIHKIDLHPFTPSQKGIIKALILGQRHDIDPALNKQYADAGMIHILAVSGLHIGIIMLLLRQLTFILRAPRLKVLRLIVILLGIWSFAILTGGSPSVLRAATMFSFLQLGNTLGKRSQSATSVLFSGLLLLLIDPMMLYQIGFQMSYLAVIAILWIQPWLSHFFYPKYYITRLIWSVITVSVSAQLGVLPLSLYYFHQFPGLFLLSNVVVLPFLGIILISGIAILSLAMSELLPEWLARTYGSTIDVLNIFIGWVAEKDAFIIEHITITFPVLLSLYLVTFLSIRVLKKLTYWRLAGVLVALLLFIGSTYHSQLDKTPSHFIVFQQSRKSLMGIVHNRQLEIFARDTLDMRFSAKVSDYQDALFIDTLSIKSLSNVFRFKRNNIFIIDSLGTYNIPDMSPNYIILTQSPNINLRRLIQQFPLTTIIADGTNYRIDIERWKLTCKEQKIPFHSTYEKGAFIIE